MKELLWDKGTWFLTLVCLFAMLLGIPVYQIKLPLQAGSFLNYYQEALQSQVILFLIPIISVLPAGAVYIKEASSGFLKFYILKTTRIDYIRKKTLQIYIGGCLPFLLSGLTALLLCFLFLYPLEQTGTFESETLLEALRLLLRICLTAGIMAEISGVFAAAFQNYYMAYGMPFVCYYMLVILKERYLPDMYAMYPAEWIGCKQGWGFGNSGIWIFLLLFSLTLMLLHGLLLYMRLQEI